MTQLNGRVFSRLQQYDALPTDLKHEAERLEEYLTTVQGDLFESHRTLTLKSVYGVRVRQLLEKIDAWLKQHGHGMPTTGHTSTAKEIKKHVPGTKEHEDHKRNVESCVPATGHSTSLGDHHTTKSHGPGTKERAKSVDEHHSVKEHIPGTKEHARKSEDYHPVKEHVPGTREHAMATDEYRPVKEHIPGTKERAMAKDEHQMKEQIPGTTEHARAKDRHTAKEHTAPSSNVGNYQTAATGTPATAPVHVITGSSSHSARAKKLLLALVLKGFVTPHKEEKPDEVISKTEDFDFKDTELLAVVSKRITGPHNTTTTVWDLVDGAVFAGMLKRKAGLLEPLTHGKNEYAIVNSRLQTLTLFTSDLGREPKLEMPTNTLKVSFDNSHYENGVKVWSNNDVELLNAADQRESDALVQALLSVGATHDKLNTAPTKTVPEKVKEATGKGAHGHETGMGGTHGHGTGMVDTHGHGSNQVHHDPHGTGVGADAAVGAGHTNDPSRGFNNQPNPHHLVKSDEQRRYDAQHMTNDLNEKNPTLDHAKDHTTEPTSGLTNQATPSHDTYGMGGGAYDKTNPTYGQGTTGSGAMKNQQQGWQDDKLNQTYGRNASPTHHAYAP